MDEIENFDARLFEVLQPEETAIIVVDVMDGYCNPKEPLPKFLEKTTGVNFIELDQVSDRIVKFLAVSRKYPIATTVFVRMVERPEYLPVSIRLKMEIDGIPPTVVQGGQGWNYYKVKPLRGDYEIIKYRYDAFIGTELDKHLKAHGVKTVIIVGGHASICVDTTARTAAQIGYHTFVPADLTADPGLSVNLQTPNEVRKKLDTINSLMGYMPLASTILNVWKNKIIKY
jgi:nicotinamidase-related amidase